jgi:L,D-transpeptidase YcbB
MRAPRTTGFRVVLIWSVSWFALSAMAAGAQGSDDILPPDLPEAVLSSDLSGVPAAPPPVAAAEPRIESPDLPAVTVSVPAAEPATEAAIPSLQAAPAPVAVADPVRTALAAELGKELEERTLRLPRKERESLAAFYETTGYQPLWVKDGAWTPAAAIVIERLKSADEDGLDAAEYPVPAVASSKAITPEDWAEAEIKLSTAAILYARDAAVQPDYAEAGTSRRRRGPRPPFRCT